MPIVIPEAPPGQSPGWSIPSKSKMSFWAFSVKGSIGASSIVDLRRIISVDVEDLLQRVDVGVDEEASVDFEGRVRAEVERLRLELLGREHLVVDVVACQEALDQAGFMSFCSGDKPYSHPPLPFSPITGSFSILLECGCFGSSSRTRSATAAAPSSPR